jgi:uncharacterized protein
MKTRKPRVKKAGKPAARTVRRVIRKKRKAAVKPKAPQRRKKPAPAEPGFSIPPILLEGDQPTWPSTGPGEKYALGPAPAAAPQGSEAGELPEAYGTGRLLLVARDPHWLYAHWDLQPQQQRQYNALSADHHLVVRVRPGTLAGHPLTEVHVHPESRSWFIHVEQAGTRYAAELGYYPANRHWVTVAASAPAVTPPDSISRDKTLRFATIPPEAPLANLVASGQPVLRTKSPSPRAVQPNTLTALLERQLRQEPASSLGVTELIRGVAEGAIAQLPAIAPAPSGAPMESVSSPSGGEALVPKGFWLNLNAELILYGATEPNASVMVGGQPIGLRPDGTFSFRFALPDGEYEVTVSACSAEGDCREARLRFSRRTDQVGEVGSAAQDPSLQPPPDKP